MENQKTPVKLRETIFIRINEYILVHGIKRAIRHILNAVSLIATALMISNPAAFNFILVSLLEAGNGFIPATVFVYLAYRYRTELRAVAVRVIGSAPAETVPDDNGTASGCTLSKFLRSAETLTIKNVMSGLGLSFRQSNRLLSKLEEIHVVKKDPDRGNARVLDPGISPERLAELVDDKDIAEISGVNVVSYAAPAPAPAPASPFIIRRIA